VSASGTSNGIVWAHENAGTAVLHAYDATNLTNELYNSIQAASGRDHCGIGNNLLRRPLRTGKCFWGRRITCACMGCCRERRIQRRGRRGPPTSQRRAFPEKSVPCLQRFASFYPSSQPLRAGLASATPPALLGERRDRRNLERRILKKIIAGGSRQSEQSGQASVPFYFFLAAAFLIRAAAVFASTSDSNPITAEYLRPTT